MSRRKDSEPRYPDILNLPAPGDPAMRAVRFGVFADRSGAWVAVNIGARGYQSEMTGEQLRKLAYWALAKAATLE